ncbi:MAG: pirin family protein [Rhodospirillales bacterium]
MIDVRPFEKLGAFRNEWLNARHHFSFADYRDPERMGWGALRVWNDDQIAPGTGFGMHGHRDMEIVTYVRRGAITHRDNLGNEGVTAAGDVQVMSAGTGILHSEVNAGAEPCLLFQIWILPRSRGVKPRWETRRFPGAGRNGRLVALASGRAEDKDAMAIHADAAILGATLGAGEAATHVLAPGRRAYIVPTLARLTINGVAVPARAGAAIADLPLITIQASQPTEIIVADVS